MNSTNDVADMPTVIHRIILGVLLLIMTVELVFLFREQQWMNVFLVIMIMGLTLAPVLLGRRFRVYIPPEFQVLAIVFVFAALFLGAFRLSEYLCVTAVLLVDTLFRPCRFSHLCSACDP